MKQLFTIATFCMLLSCVNTDNHNSGSQLLASFGEQPSLAKGHDNSVFVVFGKDSSIYISESADLGLTFSEPSMVAELNGLALGYSSGPGIAITKNEIVVTALDQSGNYYSWKKANANDNWDGPFRVNDVDNSAGEALADIASTADGRLLSVWIDTRAMPMGNHDNDSEETAPEPERENHAVQEKVEEELDEITPIGITKRELYDKIGGAPENTRLAFFGDENDNILWVFIDSQGNAVKAQDIEEFRKFRARNAGNVKMKGKLYLASSDDGGQTWTKSQLVYRSPAGSICECCKPSIFTEANGGITIMFRNNIEGSRDLYFTKSVDGGKSFSAAEKLGSGTWKINGCPMDGGSLLVDKTGELQTIWQRKGELFMANSSLSEEKIGEGKGPEIASNGLQTYIVYSSGNDIMSIDNAEMIPEKIGEGAFPKVLALDDGAIRVWMNEAGINYSRID